MALTPLRGICCLLCVRHLIEGKSREWWEGRHLTDRNNRIWQQPKTGWFQRLHLDLASNVLMLVPGQRIVLRFACRQYPALTTDRQDAGGLTAPLCLTQVGHSPKFLLHREIFQIFWAWQPKSDSLIWDLCPQQLELPQRLLGWTFQVADESLILVDSGATWSILPT